MNKRFLILFSGMTLMNRDLSLAELASVVNISLNLLCEFIQTGDENFTVSVCNSTAGGTGEIDAVENGLSDSVSVAPA